MNASSKRLIRAACNFNILMGKVCAVFFKKIEVVEPEYTNCEPSYSEINIVFGII